MEEYKKDDRGRSKAKRLTETDPHTKVDSSTWTPSAPENAGVKTGARPLVKRLYKKGGKVIGADAMKRADRKPRKAGGRAENDKAHRYLTPDNLINRDVRMANDEREGVKHIGAFKKGGVAKYGKGGRMPLEGHPYHKKTDAELRYISKDAAEAARSMKGMDSKAENKYLDQMNDAQTVLGHRQRTGNGPESGMKKGGRTHKLGGGMVGDNPISVENRSMAKATGMMKKGGRAKKARGGPEGDFAPSKNKPSLDEIGEMIRNMPQDSVYQAPKKAAPVSPSRNIDDYLQPSTGDAERAANAAAFDAQQQAYQRSLPQNRKHGGKTVHDDEAEDKKLMHKVLKPAVFKAKGGEAHGEDCGCARCHGGRTMKYGGGGVFSGNSKEKIPGATGGRHAHAKGGRTGKTTINIVMGGHGQQPQNMPNAPVQAPKPPMGVPVPPPQMAGGAPMGAGAPPMPPQMPPQMPGRATGGRTGKMVGGSLGNAQGFGQPSMGGYGQPQQPQPMMGGVGQQGMMPRKSGGRTNYPIDTGAGGANARLEKIDAYGLKPSKLK